MLSLLSEIVVTAVERGITRIMPHIPLIFVFIIYFSIKKGLSVNAGHVVTLLLLEAYKELSVVSVTARRIASCMGASKKIN